MLFLPDGSRRRPLTPAEASPTSCSLNMGALCWVLPLEEDEEMLEEEEEEEEGVEEQKNSMTESGEQRGGVETEKEERIA